MDDILEKYQHYLLKEDDLTIIVLKGHLLIEEVLDATISKFLPNADAIARANFPFFNKAALAQAICWKKPNDEIWSLIFALNTLRNDLAHNLESRKRVARFDEVLRQHAEMSVNDPDYEAVLSCSKEGQLGLAIVHVLGFLHRFKQDVEKNCGFWHLALSRQEALLKELAADATENSG